MPTPAPAPTHPHAPRPAARRAAPLLALAALATLPALPAGSAHAGPLRDPTGQAMLDGDRPAALEAAARARLQAAPADPQATLALGLAVVAGGLQPAALEATVPLAEACTAQHPRAAECHHTLGLLRGLQALRAGPIAGLRLAGRVRESFEQAVALAPTEYAYRAALMQYHLAVPAIAGGGAGKATALLRDTEARRLPEQARCLRAMQLIADEQLDEAEALLWAAPTDADADLRTAVYNLLGQVAAQRLAGKAMPKAQALFERLARLDPGRALAVYGLGRVRAESGAPQEAVKLFAQARTLRGQASLPIDYREALAWLQLGDTAQARTLLQRFLDAGRGHPQSLDDARERLRQLR